MDADPTLLSAVFGALAPGEVLTFADLAEPHEYRRAMRAHERWFRAVRMVFCACLGSFLYYVGIHLHLGPRAAEGHSNPMLVVFLVQCMPLVFMAYCGITLLLDIVQPIAWAARAKSVLYVVTNQRVLLLACTNHRFAWSIGGHVLPNDQWTWLRNRRRAAREAISIRTVNAIINVRVNHANVVLAHHDTQDDHGHWCPSSSTLIPGVRNPFRMSERIKEMLTYRQGPCPRVFGHDAPDPCPCVVTEAEPQGSAQRCA